MNVPEYLCSINEYEAGIKTPLKEEKVSIGGLCVVMFALREDPDQAAKFPARVSRLRMSNTGPNRLGFVILSPDLQPLSGTLFSDISQGHLTHSPITIPPEYTTDRGYLAAYGDAGGFEDELRELMSNEAVFATTRS